MAKVEKDKSDSGKAEVLAEARQASELAAAKPQGEPAPEPPPAEPRSVALERAVRRYLKPDGVFRKGLSPRDIETARTLCERSGRKVLTDTLTKRLKATPGWDNGLETRRTAEQQLKEKAR